MDKETLDEMIKKISDDFVKIYKIKDLTTGNCYIGSTKQNISERISRHKNYLKTGEYCSSCIVLNNDNWEYEHVATCHKNNRKETERYYINNTPNCINERKLNFNKKEWSSQKVTCDCGCEVSRGYLNKHKKTRIHEYNILKKQSL